MDFCVDDFLGAGSNSISYTTTPAPARIYYNVALKMLGLANDFQVPEPGSAEFDHLSRIANVVENNLNKVTGLEAVAVTRFSE